MKLAKIRQDLKRWVPETRRQDMQALPPKADGRPKGRFKNPNFGPGCWWQSHSSERAELKRGPGRLLEACIALRFWQPCKLRY